MIRMLSSTLAVVAGLAALASVAAAGVPDATMSTTDGDLMLGNARGLAVLSLPNVEQGRPFGVEAVTDGYQVTVCDAGGSPLPGVVVTMHFNGTGLRVHASQSGTQTAPDCGNLNLIQATTDALGRVTFLPAVVGINSSPFPNVQIRAGGVLLVTIRVPSIDLGCSGGGQPGRVDGYDLNVFRLRFLGLPPYSSNDPACDYATGDDPPGGFTVNGFDLNVMRTEFLCGQAGAPVQEPCTQLQCDVCP